VDGKYSDEDKEWLLETEGANLLQVMSIPEVNHTKTVSNHIIEVFTVSRRCASSLLRRSRACSCLLLATLFSEALPAN
jgi:hypothetical protein